MFWNWLAVQILIDLTVGSLFFFAIGSNMNIDELKHTVMIFILEFIRASCFILHFLSLFHPPTLIVCPALINPTCVLVFCPLFVLKFLAWLFVDLVFASLSFTKKSSWTEAASTSGSKLCLSTLGTQSWHSSWEDKEHFWSHISILKISHITRCNVKCAAHDDSEFSANSAARQGALSLFSLLCWYVCSLSSRETVLANAWWKQWGILLLSQG